MNIKNNVTSYISYVSSERSNIRNMLMSQILATFCQSVAKSVE